jgi:excisionase family DNA binding protein
VSAKQTSSQDLGTLSQLLTVEETAAYLRVGRGLAYELIRRGELPAVRLGRLVRVPRAALEAFVKVGGAE